jgi:trimeric autotransporter adhesin
MKTKNPRSPRRIAAGLCAFIGKFDSNLNPIFITYAGSGGLAVTTIAATADAVFVTGSIFGATLPVTPSAIIQSPAPGSLQNGFVERFNATGTTLVYATYLSGQSPSGQAANTAPAAIAADSSDNAYIAGYTTASGYPTLNALIPDIVPNAPNTTSGFLTKLTPAGDGLLFSTFIPGPGITSIALAPGIQDPTKQNLLLSGAIALGQFPIATVSTPIVNTTYQTLLRLPLDGSAVLSSTLLAPGTQSTLTTAPNQSTWITSTLSTPSWLLPLTPLSTIGNSYAIRVTQQNQIDQTLRFGGVPTTNPTFASAPVTLTSVTTDPMGEPIFAGSVSPTASSSLLATETYDLPLYNTPTSTLPSNLRAAALPSGSCTGSLCSGSAAYLTKLNPTAAAPSLALSTDATPNITLRNFGSQAATNLQLTATNFIIAHTCSTTLAPGAECSIALTSTSTNSGTLTAQADNATPQTATLPATTAQPNPIAFSPKELDFGIVTSTSPAATRTISVTNLTQQPQTFTSKLGSNQLTPYLFAESSTTCPLTSQNTYTIAANAACTLTLSFTASSTTADDGFAQSNWTIGSGSVLLTAYTQAASLNLSATEIDFGTQFGTVPSTNPFAPRLPRYLYLSNNSAAPIPHTPVTLAAPFTLTDRCPTNLTPHSVCQFEITYQSPIAPSADSTTLTLDQNMTVLITGSTLPLSSGTGQAANPNLTVTPATVTFPNPVLVTSTSSTTQPVTIANIGAQPFNLSLALAGDFTDTTDCPDLLPANSTCTVLITFAPSQPGPPGPPLHHRRQRNLSRLRQPDRHRHRGLHSTQQHPHLRRSPPLPARRPVDQNHRPLLHPHRCQLRARLQSHPHRRHRLRPRSATHLGLHQYLHRSLHQLLARCAVHPLRLRSSDRNPDPELHRLRHTFPLHPHRNRPSPHRPHPHSHHAGLRSHPGPQHQRPHSLHPYQSHRLHRLCLHPNHHRRLHPRKRSNSPHRRPDLLRILSPQRLLLR